MNYSSFSEYPEECEDCKGKRFYPGCKKFCILDFDDNDDKEIPSREHKRWCENPSCPCRSI